MKIVVRTETWTTKNGRVIKAVVRETDGTFVGATNQTKPVKVRTPRPRVTVVGK